MTCPPLATNPNELYSTFLTGGMAVPARRSSSAITSVSCLVNSTR
nr:hypothetical protein [Candidatus Sigynarchaeota archaeon]